MDTTTTHRDTDPARKALGAVTMYGILSAAAQGSPRAFDRLSTLAVIMPVAIIGVDLLPGICPPWYAVTQTACMLPVLRVAYLTRSTPLRTAFPKGK